MARTTAADIGAALARIEAQQEGIALRVTRIEAKLDALPQPFNPAALELRVGRVEGWQTWMGRTVGGAVLAGLLGLLGLARVGVVAIVAIGALAAMASPARAEWRIADDPGGSIELYRIKYAALAGEGRRVVVDGDCFSACTLVLSLPRGQACATPRAVLGFHSAWVPGRGGRPVFSREGTAVLWAAYPPEARALLRRRGWSGRTPHPDLIRISGPTLARILEPC